MNYKRLAFLSRTEWIRSLTSDEGEYMIRNLRTLTLALIVCVLPLTASAGDFLTNQSP